MTREDLHIGANLFNDGWCFARGDHDGPLEAYQPVWIPHDWAVHQEVREDAELGTSQGFFDDRGIGWYRKAFTIDNVSFRYALHFDGIMEESTVWVNGIEVGGHGWGYTPFQVDISSALREGQNEVIVRVDCSARPADRWYSGCGIYRDVTLYKTSEIYLDARDIVVTQEHHKDNVMLHIVTGIPQRVSACLTAPNGEQFVADGNGSIDMIVTHPLKWSHAHPWLYSLRLSLPGQEDEVTIRIGLRSCQFTPDHGFLVNDEPVYLRGACLHQDIACVGIASTQELWRTRLEELKAFGFNAVRCAHHMHSALFMDLCDEMGFYVYEEFADKWHSGSYHRYLSREWQEDIDAMLRRDRNRPCVVVWGCGNEVENQAQPSMLKTLKLFTEYIRSVDPTRPVTYAMNPHFKRFSGIDAADVKDIQTFVNEADEYEIEDLDERVECIARIAEYVDLLSCNYQEQWFKRIHAALPDKSILGTEVYQFFLGDEQNMQNFSQDMLPVQFGEQFPACAGSFIWVGFDYLGESQLWPNKGSASGVFRSNGLPRAGAYILRALWRDEPLVRLFIMDYTLPSEMVKEHWSVPPYEETWDFPGIVRQVVPFLVATNCERISIAYRDKTQHYRANGKGYITGFLPYFPGSVRVAGYIGDKEVCSHVLRTPGKLAHLALRMPKLPDNAAKGYCFFVHIQAEDAENVRVIRAAEDVHFALEGPCDLVGVDNGSMACHVPFHASHIPLYRGQASVLLRMQGGHGQVVLRAWTDSGIEGTVSFIV
ncbi:MAG: glycoside hydrolase family 2 protein [Clostridia bacterium]|nr:glycoside hydrolase family 2 protein [Clostridia bacterium]